MWRVFLLLPMGALWACNRPGCDGSGTVPSAGAPLIRAATYLNSEPTNSWALICSLDFVASQGDLGGGKLLLYSSGGPAPDSVTELANVLMASDLAQDATAGTLGFVVPFEPTLKDGQNVRLGLQLEATPPAAGTLGKRSNCYELDLAFSVSPTARTLLPAARRAGLRLAALAPQVAP